MGTSVFRLAGDEELGKRGAGLDDPDRVVDHPPGAVGSIYKAHLTRPEVRAVIAPPSP